MIQYNTKEWFTFIFKLHKADTFRKLMPLMFSIGVYTALIYYVEDCWLQLTADHYLKNITLMHNTLGFVISLLLVFRTNTAYDRWWEGRRQWGSLVNTSRALAIKLNTVAAPHLKKELSYFTSMYAFAVKAHLRGNKEPKELINDYHTFNSEKHLPNQVVSVLSQKTYQLVQNQQLPNELLISINTDLNEFANICGACERIKNTPIPFSYSVFIKKFIFFYIMTLPIGYALLLHYWVVPIVVFIFYVLTSLELIAEEIEDPFGTDSNDLPLDNICKNIKQNTEDIFIS